MDGSVLTTFVSCPDSKNPVILAAYPYPLSACDSIELNLSWIVIATFSPTAAPIPLSKHDHKKKELNVLEYDSVGQSPWAWK